MNVIRTPSIVLLSGMLNNNTVRCCKFLLKNIFVLLFPSHDQGPGDEQVGGHDEEDGHAVDGSVDPLLHHRDCRVTHPGVKQHLTIWGDSEVEQGDEVVTAGDRDIINDKDNNLIGDIPDEEVDKYDSKVKITH